MILIFVVIIVAMIVTAVIFCSACHLNDRLN
jgi:hypothetical protein